MLWEINWTGYIEEDFLENGFSDKEILSAKAKVELASQSPSRLKKVYGFPRGCDVRRVRYRNFRIFLLLNWIAEQIDCLRMFIAHKGYKTRQKNQILTVIQKSSRVNI